MRGADESRQRVAGDYDPNHFRGDLAHVPHLEQACFGFVANPASRAFHRLGHFGHGVPSVIASSKT
jgi:hypothetical protein